MHEKLEMQRSCIAVRQPCPVGSLTVADLKATARTWATWKAGGLDGWAIGWGSRLTGSGGARLGGLQPQFFKKTSKNLSMFLSWTPCGVSCCDMAAKELFVRFMAFKRKLDGFKAGVRKRQSFSATEGNNP